QCSIGDCFTGEYYNQFVHSENVDCPSSEMFQRREHILIRECPQYADQRPILESVRGMYPCPKCWELERASLP
ncbi:hypothetical protein B0H19DRAFT_940261, partial [Mycena capillaripes]